MNYLLDTHTLIWSITGKKKIIRSGKKAIENTDNDIFVSAISFWEISLKSSLGKLDLQGITPQEFPQLAMQTGFMLLPLKPEETATYHQLTGNWHQDPFDRMLIWQAIRQSFILISKDEYIVKYSSEGLRTYW